MRPMLIIWIIAIILLASNIYALGIAPGHTDITFEPGAEHKVTLKLINNDNQPMKVLLYAEGELAGYISFEQPMIELKASEKEHYAYYTIRLPQSFEKQGPHTTNIVSRAIPTNAGAEGVGMSASVAVVSKLNVMVPYSGKYAELTLFTPNFEGGKGGNFAVEVRSLGTQDILQAQLVIDVYGPMNNKLTTLTGDKFSLASKDKKILTINWMPTVSLGNYRAVANLIYDNANAKDERPFSIGQFTIDIIDITVKDFKLGGIAMFDIMLENKWNERIPGVFGEVSVKDESGKVQTQFKTASVDVNENEKQAIQAYWDTKNAGPGNYKLDIILNYLGQKTEKIFDILVSVDKIDTNLAAQVVSAEQKQNQPVLQGIYILTFLVILLIIFNVIMFLRKAKQKT